MKHRPKDIVLATLTFPDQSGKKKRPCLILKTIELDTYQVLAIKSHKHSHIPQYKLRRKDFLDKPLHKDSYVNTDEIHTISAQSIIRHLTSIKPLAFRDIALIAKPSV